MNLLKNELKQLVTTPPPAESSNYFCGSAFIKKYFKKTVSFTIASLLATSMVMPTLAFADEDDDEYYAEEHHTTGHVEVTATRSTKDLMEVPMSVSVITSEEIEKSTALTVANLLSKLPGVSMRQANNVNADTVTIRGESVLRTLYLIDGQKFADIMSLDGTDIVIDLSTIERIEVIKGPASLLYGSDAMGGVVNFITKKGAGKPIQGSIRSSYSSATNGITTSLNVYGSVKDFDYRANISANKYNDYESFHEKLDNTNGEDYAGDLYLRYNLTDNLSVGGGYLKVKTNYKYQNHLLTSSSVTSHTNIESSTTKYNTFIEAKQITDFFSRFYLNGYYQEFVKTVDPQYTDGSGSSGTNYTSPTKSTGLTLQTDFIVTDDIFIIAGYDFVHESVKIDRYASSGVLSGERYAEDNNHAAFILVEHTLPADFTLSYGARYTLVNSKLNKMTAYSTSTGALSTSRTPTEDTQSAPVFNIGLVWMGIDDLALRASWGQGFRVANLYEKYAEAYSSMSGGTLMGDPDLNPETSNNFEIGARYYNGDLSVDLALFYTIANDYITSNSSDAATDPDSYYYYKNYNEMKKWGVELEVSYELPFGITPYFTGAFVRRQLDDGVYNSGIPAFTGLGGARYKKNFVEEKFTLNADFYAQGQTQVDKNTTQFQYTYLPSFATLNLSIGGDFGEKRDIFAQLELLNILDKRYNLGNSQPWQPGFNANLIVGAKF